MEGGGISSKANLWEYVGFFRSSAHSIGITLQRRKSGLGLNRLESNEPFWQGIWSEVVLDFISGKPTIRVEWRPGVRRWEKRKTSAMTWNAYVRECRLTTSRAIIQRLCTAPRAGGGSAMPMPRTRSGIHACCRPEKKAAKDRSRRSRVIVLSEVPYSNHLIAL
jgi:hypothetical protein